MEEGASPIIPARKTTARREKGSMVPDLDQLELDIHRFLASYDRTSHQREVAKAEEHRKRLLERFPLERWPHLTLEEYALGLSTDQHTWCHELEYTSTELGSIRGGSAEKMVIYKRKSKSGWYYPQRFSNEQDAWGALRTEFLDSFSKAERGAWDDIELNLGQAVRLKTLHIYYPHDVLPVYSKDHLGHFLEALGVPHAVFARSDLLAVNRQLMSQLQAFPVLSDWTTKELEAMLYNWTDPRRRVVKIAPGRDAEFWDECLDGGYICVGWDDVGDLREFESKTAFRAAFAEAYGRTYDASKLTTKGNELWRFRELQAGDVVVANKGTAKVLAVGQVKGPGYQWRGDRETYRHTLPVAWDTSRAQDITPQGRWAFSTVATVGRSLRQQLLTRGSVPNPVDPLFLEMDDALMRKGQAVLYGPPGTGKTYTARRFSVWWVLRNAGREKEASSLLADPDRFAQLEREVSAAQVARKTWWMVANPREWSWDQLFKDGSVEYRYGKIQKNYTLAQPGDLVVGYQATPVKRLVAVARISRGLDTSGESPTLQVEPVARVSNGLSYDELQRDTLLVNSEPMRHRNQGTLFQLTARESEHLLSLLEERNPELQGKLESWEGIAQITRLTFHPSYSYEDFVEGFRPVDSGQGGLSLRLEDGVFKRVCLEAKTHADKVYLVIIDEINRANIAKVFGELITVLEKDKRDLAVTLPQSRESFSIPSNLFLLGTMNTADRSIKLLDSALRRRFAFIELMPDLELFRGARVGDLPLDVFLEELNRRIAASEGREKQVGHSFLLDGSRPLRDREEFARRFRQEILPLLQEYCYTDYATLAMYIGSDLVNEENQSIATREVRDADRLLRALIKEFISKAADYALDGE
ncbi:AAA family ATPase [Candidatus Palauibacter soopunensis]|uniref:AAA family ATPase n=1 Tax=Candidatus Palauibacter soopunensis TaxID=3056739 RepID=UPI0023864700|nr:AAA family ATPase [Candidatus Palauibacter soopunensis]MDE2878892.1 AAA family ATPase [Candidatus Palauibacter soopunensis]